MGGEINLTVIFAGLHLAMWLGPRCLQTIESWLHHSGSLGQVVSLSLGISFLISDTGGTRVKINVC